MPRHKNKKIQATSESLNNLLQEIYNECVGQHTAATQQRNKILKELEELEDVQMVGKLTVDLLKIIDLTIDKKLALAKLQIGLITGGKVKEETEGDMTTEQKQFLMNVMKKANNKESVDIELG